MDPSNTIFGTKIEPDPKITFRVLTVLGPKLPFFEPKLILLDFTPRDPPDTACAGPVTRQSPAGMQAVQVSRSTRTFQAGPVPPRIGNLQGTRRPPDAASRSADSRRRAAEFAAEKRQKFRQNPV